MVAVAVDEGMLRLRDDGLQQGPRRPHLDRRGRTHDQQPPLDGVRDRSAPHRDPRRIGALSAVGARPLRPDLGTREQALVLDRRSPDHARRGRPCSSAAPRRSPALAAVPPQRPQASPHAAHRAPCPARANTAARSCPASNPLNQDISHAPVDPNSARYIASIGLAAHLHPDFGTNPGYGIPYAVVGPAPAEGADHVHRIRRRIGPGPLSRAAATRRSRAAGEEGDRHVLVLQRAAAGCTSSTRPPVAAAAGKRRSGARLQPAQQRAAPGRLDVGRRRRPADLPAAGPLRARLRAGAIDHALRVTVAAHAARLHPPGHALRLRRARDPALPPMGLRLRLKAGYSLAGFHGQAL